MILGEPDRHESEPAVIERMTRHRPTWLLHQVMMTAQYQRVPHVPGMVNKGFFIYEWRTQTAGLEKPQQSQLALL